MAVFYEAEIKICSVIEDLNSAGLPEGEPERTEQSTLGFLKASGDGGYLLTYSEENENGRTDTDLAVLTCGGISLKRRGALVSELYFKKGERFKTEYKIPPCSFDMTVETKRVSSTLCEEGGEIRLLYLMSVGGSKRQVRMTLSVTPKKGGDKG